MNPDGNSLAVKFECTQCGRCCSWGGIVKVFPSDLDRLLCWTSLPREVFVETYFETVEETHEFLDSTVQFRILGAKQVESRCVFLDGKLCSVHEHKPLICRLAPFSYSHWNCVTHREFYIRNSPGFGKGLGWSQDRIIKSVEEEISAWQSYLTAFERISGRWWQLYKLSAEPDIPLHRLKGYHRKTYACADSH